VDPPYDTAQFKIFFFTYRMPSLDENPMYNNKLHIKFDPPLLDFRERLVNIYYMSNPVYM
jgi:hypothetical protein